ncbi:hypothetical protein RI543_003003 [Arxiozyma heterogenica]|uniref:Uncharacterized protein n=2 Tax=Arxiozyma heterogenica TaxID=278026 RepID=A0AAN7WLV3_9SACH|nr:hypothetical protein RI543_003003 [Kazachstania heterogenica]
MSHKKSEEQIKPTTTKKPPLADYRSRSTNGLSEPKEDINSSYPTALEKDRNNCKKKRISFRELFKIKPSRNSSCPENKQLTQCQPTSLNSGNRVVIDKDPSTYVNQMPQSNQENSRNSSLPQNLDEGTTGMLSSDLKTLCVDDSSSNSNVISEIENSLELTNSRNFNNIDTNRDVSYYKQLGQQFEHIMFQLYTKEQINDVNRDQAMLDFMRNVCSLQTQNKELMNQNEGYKVTLLDLKQQLFDNNMKKKSELKQFQKLHENKMNIIKQHEQTNKTLQEKIQNLERIIKTRTNVQMFYFDKSVKIYSTVKEIFAQTIDNESAKTFNLCLNDLIEHMKDFNDIKIIDFESIKTTITKFFNNEFIKIFLVDYSKNKQFDHLIDKLALLESENAILEAKIQKQKKILKLIESNIGLPSLQNNL